MKRAPSAEEAVDERMESAAPTPDCGGAVAAKYLMGLCRTIARASSVVKSFAGNGAGYPGGRARFIHDLDVLAFGIAVDSALFFESGYRDEPVSNTVKAWAGVTMTAVCQFLSALEALSPATEGSGEAAQGDIEGSIHNATQTIGRLRDGLRFLCTWWIITEALTLVAEARTLARRAGGGGTFG